jgi:hypothetical protein
MYKNSYNEEDTFDRLRRISLIEMVEILRTTTLPNNGYYHEFVVNLMKQYGWSSEEYSEEICKLTQR